MKPKLCFIHAAGGDRTQWQLQRRYFASHGFDADVVDLPGHGREPGPPLGSIEAGGAWLVGRLDETPVHLVGSSMGALIALEAAAKRPDLVRSLALLGVGETMRVHPDLLAAARDGDPLAIDLMVSWCISRGAHAGGHSTPGLWIMGATRRILERQGLDVLATDLAACDAYRGALGAAQAVACPTLFLTGERDVMTRPAGARPLAAVIDGAQWVVIPGAGHFAMIEQPDAVIDALAGFLSVLADQ